MARRTTSFVQIHNPHGEPRPHSVGALLKQDHRRRRIRLLGARWVICHVSRSTGETPGVVGRRLKTMERRRATTVSSHEDHETTGCAKFQECHQSQRRRNALGKVRGRWPTPTARARPADLRPLAGCRCSTPRGPTQRRVNAQLVSPIQRRDLSR